MKLTNKFNLPRPFVEYERAVKYSRGDASYSATDLIGPPRIRILRAANEDQIESDISDRVFALLGTATHQILSTGVSGNGSCSEERLITDVGGITISGQIDLQERNEDGTITVSDFKVCSWYAIKDGPKQDWIEQLNIYAQLVYAGSDGWAAQTGSTIVSKVQVYAIIRDWTRRMAERTEGYPQAPIATVPIPLWSADDRDDYVSERVRLHALADTSFDLEEEEPPHCSDEERWAQPTKWALMKKGRKTAVKLFNSENAAQDALSTAAPKPYVTGNYYVEERPGRYTRCEEDYCGVSNWCSQYQKELSEK